MIESLEGEIRTLRSLFWSDRDPDGRAFAPLADAYRRAGDLRHALELLKDGLDRHPAFVSGHVVSAWVHLDAGLVHEAVLAARKALEFDAENVEALRVLADGLEADDDAEGAAEARSRLGELDPEEAPPPQEEPSGTEPAMEADEAAAPAAEEPAMEPEEAAAPVAEEPATAPGEAAAPAAEEPVSASKASVRAEEEVTLAPEEPSEEVDVFPEEAPAAVSPVPEEAGTEAAGVEDEAWDLAALAPVPSEEATASDEDVWDIAALAPDPSEEAASPSAVVDIATLAPAETADAGAAGEVWDIAALAPDEPAHEAVATLVVDIASLAPEEPASAPGEAADEPAPETEVWDIAALAPDESGDGGGDRGDGGDESGEDELSVGEGEPLYTRTMADLFARQGLTERALDVYRHLLEDHPGDTDLLERIARLEADADREDEEEESEIQARRLAASGEGGHDVDTPFTWTESEGPEVRSDAPPVGEYFRRMLSWTAPDEESEEGRE